MDTNNKINMIFGAPGCGKTTYLINLLDKLLQTHEPNKIAFVSFTRKGSYEGRDRAMSKFNYKEKDFPFFRTLHSIAFKELGVSRSDMITKRHYKEFSKAMGMNFLGYYTEDLINNDDKYLFYNSLEINNQRVFNNTINDINYKTYQEVKENYKRFKQEVYIKDFDDLILNFVQENIALPVDIAIIDEAQDLTSLQWKFCQTAFKNCKEIYIAGDDDQAIYEWNGADVEHFLSLSKNAVNIILNQSYRLKKNILNFSKKVSAKISNRINKEFAPIESGGEIYFYNQLEDIQINSEESYYFLSRNNYFLRKYRDLLKNMGLTYFDKNDYSVDIGIYNAIKKHEYNRKHDINNVSTDSSVLPFLRKDRRREEVWFHAFDLRVDKSNYFRKIFKNKTDVKKESCKITINTIHGVKGGEADNIVLLLDLTSSVGKNLLGKQELFNAEMRCLYVALTRAKKNLHIVFSGSKFGYDKIIKGIK